MDNLLDNPLLQDLNYERVVKYAVDFVRKVGMPKAFIKKVEKIDIHEHRGILPCDFYKSIQAENNKVCMRYTTSSFDDVHTPEYDETYHIKGKYIFTSLREGKITLAYEALPVDCDGWPMIADEPSFIEALELYVQKKHLFPKVAQGIINLQVYGQIEQQYAWAVGQAQTALIRPNLDEMQSLTNMWNTLVPRMSDHRNGFLTEGTKELIRKH